MSIRQFLWRGLLLATTGMFLSLAVAGVVGANDGYDRIPSAGELRDRFSQRDTGSIINRYHYGDGNPVESHDPDGH